MTVLRSRDAEPTVTNMELFFDLVYVFAITQLSHTLLEHLTGRGALETLVLFGAVWWAWNYMAWATNWIDPDTTAVRVLIVGLMVLSLVMAAAIPEAFAEHALEFAGAYVAIQLGRAAFMVWAQRGSPMGRNQAQLMAWSAIAGMFWIGGALAGGDARLVLWVAALAIDVSAPTHQFWLPGLGATPFESWTLRPGHLAERCQLVVIIALGESVLVTGQQFAALERSTATSLAFISCFLGSAALWWLYFARHAAAALSRVARSDVPTREGRGAYAYAHAVMVAGIIAVAVGDELTIAHPHGHVSTAALLCVVGGPALYVLGMRLFVSAAGGVERQEHWAMIAGLAAAVLLVAISGLISPLALSGLTTAVLFALVAYAAIHAQRSRRANASDGQPEHADHVDDDPRQQPRAGVVGAAQRAQLDDRPRDAGDVAHQQAQRVAVERLEGQQPARRCRRSTAAVPEFRASPIVPSSPATSPAPNTMSTAMPFAVALQEHRAAASEIAATAATASAIRRPEATGWSGHQSPMTPVTTTAAA